MIEMGHLMTMGEAVIVPALEYLFHKVERQFDGRPTLMIVDEAWLFLGHPVFASRLQAWLKTLRKKNVYVVFATQEVADATSKPELLSTILSACHTKIFLPDDEALTPAMMAAYQTVGLTAAEVDILAKAQKKRDYYYRSVKGRRLFQLGLGPAALAFVGASSEGDQRFLDEMIATRSPSEYARAMLERRGVTWAAAELELARSAHAAADEAKPTRTPVAPSRPPFAPPPMAARAGAGDANDAKAIRIAVAPSRRSVAPRPATMRPDSSDVIADDAKTVPYPVSPSRRLPPPLPAAELARSDDAIADDAKTIRDPVAPPRRSPPPLPESVRTPTRRRAP